MGLVRNIEVNTTTVNSVGVGPDVLHSFSLPADSLRTNGDYLAVWYGGNFAANARPKSVQAQFDGQDYEAAGPVDIQAAVGWAMVVRIARLTATTVQISHFLLENAMGITAAGVAGSFGTGSNIFTRSTGLTVANLSSNAITMRVRSVVAAGAVAGDVFQNLSIIEIVQN
jgi:hypothetical protein